MPFQHVITSIFDYFRKKKEKKKETLIFTDSLTVKDALKTVLADGFLQLHNPFRKKEGTLAFVSGFAIRDILRMVLTNGVLYLYEKSNKKAWKDLNDVVHALADFFKVEVFYTDGAVVWIPECGEIDLEKFTKLIGCRVVEPFILLTRPELWKLDETKRLNAVLGIETISIMARKNGYGVVVSCPVDKANNYEISTLKRSTQIHIADWLLRECNLLEYFHPEKYFIVKGDLYAGECH